MKNSSASRSDRAYTLIEALVASSVLLIGISAAASLSLAMVTQEEINERANRAFNHVDNVTRLLQLGIPPEQLGADASYTGVRLLPENDVISDLTIQAQPVNVAGLGKRERWWIKFEYQATDATASSPIANGWTGGLDTDKRSRAFYVYRSRHFQDEDLPRVKWAKSGS